MAKCTNKKTRKERGNNNNAKARNYGTKRRDRQTPVRDNKREWKQEIQNFQMF